MLGGSATVPPADAFSGVAFILNLAMRMTDPERRALREDIEKLIEAGRRAEHAIAELHHREQALLHREQQAMKHEQVLAVPLLWGRVARPARCRSGHSICSPLPLVAAAGRRPLPV